MKASLRSVRIAPKKANIIAKMVRGLKVVEALSQLKRTNKKGARLVEDLLKSAVANAKHNDSQNEDTLEIRSITVNQGSGYRRGVPMARGRIRPMTKFLSHIDITLGLAKNIVDGTPDKKEKSAPAAKKSAPAAKAKTSQKAKNTVKPSSKKTSSPSSPSK